MYVWQLHNFFVRCELDHRLTAMHVSLYMAMFRFYHDNHFDNPVSVSRSKLMKTCKIKGIATYHKCLKDLVGWGYIKYRPSYHPDKGSLVCLNEILENVTTDNN